MIDASQINPNLTNIDSRKGYFSHPLAASALLLVILIYVFLYSTTSILTFHNFGMSAYDIGVNVQAIWKIATGRGLFNTVRGLSIWGDHCWFIMIFLAPFYWIFPRLEIMLLVQTIALASGAIPLAILTYRRSQSVMISLFLAIAWLISPALQNMNLENFHTEMVAVPFLLWAVERADIKAWKGYSVMIILALLCKEDVSLTVFFIGFWVCFSLKQRRYGILTMLFSVIWFILCMKVFLPFFNQQGFFRFQHGYWFSQFWTNKFEPVFYWKIVSQSRVFEYVWKLGSPVLFLGILEPMLVLAVLPGFIVNLLSGNSYLISIDYHYNFQTLPMLFAATSMVLARLNHWKGFRKWVARIAVAGILFASIWANINWSQLPIKDAPKRIVEQYRYFRSSGKYETFKRFIEYIPADPDVPISVSHNLVPHLAHRNEVYMFPNPYQAYYWGINGENLPSSDPIQTLFIDLNSMGQDLVNLAKQLILTENFSIVAQEGAWIIAQKQVGSKNAQIFDPLDMPAPEQAIRLIIYKFEHPITSLTPLWAKKPDIELTTTICHIPATFDELSTAEGFTLEARDNVRIVFIGQWEAAGKKDIVFRIQSDDGCRVYLDGDIIIDHGGLHPLAEKVESQVFRLSSGWHKIVLDYFESGDRAGLLLEWKEASQDAFQPLRAGVRLP